jgi:hypothetical protein
LLSNNAPFKAVPRRLRNIPGKKRPSLRNHGFRDGRFARRTICIRLQVVDGDGMEIGMEINSSRSQSESGGTSQSRYELKVLVVYEEIYMGLQGKEVFDLIEREAGGGAAQLTVWRFDIIGSPTMARSAARQAAEADVIIVAPRNPDTVPMQVRAWLEHWSAHRQNGHGALVALLDARTAATGRPSQVAMLLQRAAQRASMSYFFCKVPVAERRAARSAYYAEAMTGLFPELQQARYAEACGVPG